MTAHASLPEPSQGGGERRYTTAMLLFVGLSYIYILVVILSEILFHRRSDPAWPPEHSTDRPIINCLL
jgi:hypothetical protein